MGDPTSRTAPTTVEFMIDGSVVTQPGSRVIASDSGGWHISFVTKIVLIAANDSR